MSGSLLLPKSGRVSSLVVCTPRVKGFTSGPVNCTPSTDLHTAFNAVLFTVFTAISLDETLVCTPFKVAVPDTIFLDGEVLL